MNYEVTATRKRPRTFDELTGQEFVVESLKNGIAKGHIAHAYLFAGPRGVGKTSAARILAKALNCPDGPSPEACPDSEESESITRGNAIDVIEIDGASNTSVNDVRQIKDEVLFGPTRLRYKIYIIDEVHMLSNSAFNALLKTIEEPPPYVVFIFATTEIHKVPATIRSRCQQFNFRLIPLEGIVEALRGVTTESNLEAEEEALLWIAREAQGSLRDAYTLYDQIASFSTGRITMERIREILGVGGLEQMHGLVRLLAQADAAGATEQMDGLLHAGMSSERFLAELADYVRTLLLVRSGVSNPSVLGGTVEQFPQEVVDAFSRSQLLHGLDRILEAYRKLRYTLRPRFELEVLLQELAFLRDHVHPRDLVAELRELSRAVASGESAGGRRPGVGRKGAAAAGATPGGAGSAAGAAGTPAASEPADAGSAAAAAPTGAAAPRALDDAAIATVSTILEERKPTLAATLKKADRWQEEPAGTLRISFADRFAANTVRQELALVAEAAEQALGRGVSIKVTDHATESAGGEGEDVSETRDETVEMVREVFRGRVVEE
ncbi:MAG: DNA polymerase III subunit gamma/tau [Spirochaetaceae bacterium]